LKKRSWTAEEISLLKQGQIPQGRSCFSIKCMKQRLGLASFKASRWTKEHKNQLVELVKEGKSQKEIAKILPYSPRGIQKQIMRMNLPRRRQYKFKMSELKKFKDFLEKNWQQRTPAELTAEWNKDNQKKIIKRKVEYHLRKMGIKIPKDESLRLGFLKRKEKRIYENCRTTVESSNKIKSLRIDLMRKRIEQNKDLWTGLPGHNPFSWGDD